MPLPRGVKIKRNGIEFESRIDRTKYLLTELSRAALRDSGRLISRRAIDKARKLRGLKRGRRPRNAFQYWVRKRDGDLLVGIKHNTWYGADQEIGSSRQPKRGILRSSTFDNIDDIRKVQGRYLSSIEDENKALGLINEDDEGGDADG